MVSLPVTSDKVSKSSTVDIEILLDATDIEEDEELEVRMSELSEEDNEEGTEEDSNEDSNEDGSGIDPIALAAIGLGIYLFARMKY